MKHSIGALAALLLSAALQASPPADLKIEIPQGPKPWNNLDIKQGPERFQFAVVTDRTGGHRGHVFQDGIDKLNLLQPDFVMSVGDFIEGYSTDPVQIENEWEEFTGYIKKLSVPFFYVPGNHDVQNPVQLEAWKKRFGADYFHFVYRDVLFLCLNSDDPYPSKFGEAQLAWAAKVLAQNKNVRWTLVFFHRPLWVPQESEGKKVANPSSRFGDLEAMLKDRKYTVFTGHFHNYQKFVRQDRNYFVLATTGGGSDMRGPAFGEFDHVAWVTMTESGPLVANVLLDGVWDENVVTEKSSGLMKRLTAAVPSQESPLFFDQLSIQGASVKLRCNNTADLPLKLKLEFLENSALLPEQTRIEEVVPPNSVKFFELPLKAVGELKVASLKSVPYEWTLAYEGGHQPPLKIKGTSRLYIEGPQDLPVLAKPFKLDGKLDEWGELPIVCEASRPPQVDQEKWSGPKDCSFRFALRHDDKAFYVALKVTDDLRLTASKEDPYNQDGVWLALDAEPQSNAKLPEKQRKNVFGLMLLPGRTLKDSYDVARQQGWAAAGVEGACVDAKGGYHCEAVIPYADMAKRLGKAAQAVKFNVNVYDFDPSESQEKAIYFNWRPANDSASAYPMQGTFYIK